jgi:hypothetical protein
MMQKEKSYEDEAPKKFRIHLLKNKNRVIR